MLKNVILCLFYFSIFDIKYILQTLVKKKKIEEDISLQAQIYLKSAEDKDLIITMIYPE